MGFTVGLFGIVPQILMLAITIALVLYLLGKLFAALTRGEVKSND